MYALFKDGEQISEKSYFPIIWNHAFAEELAFYAWIGEVSKAEVRLKKGYTIEEVKE